MHCTRVGPTNRKWAGAAAVHMIEKHAPRGDGKRCAIVKFTHGSFVYLILYRLASLSPTTAAAESRRSEFLFLAT